MIKRPVSGGDLVGSLVRMESSVPWSSSQLNKECGVGHCTTFNNQSFDAVMAARMLTRFSLTQELSIDLITAKYLLL